MDLQSILRQVDPNATIEEQLATCDYNLRKLSQVQGAAAEATLAALQIPETSGCLLVVAITRGVLLDHQERLRKAEASRQAKNN